MIRRADADNTIGPANFRNYQIFFAGKWYGFNQSVPLYMRDKPEFLDEKGSKVTCEFEFKLLVSPVKAINGSPQHRYSGQYILKLHLGPSPMLGAPRF